GEIAELIGLRRFDQSKVRVNGLLEDAALAVDHALFLAVGHFRAHADGGVEAEQTRRRRAHPFAQNPLRHNFAGDFPLRVALLKVVRARAGESGDDMAHLAILEHDAELAFARPAIVAYRGDLFDALARQRLNQIIGETGATESSKHDARAIGNIRDGG